MRKILIAVLLLPMMFIGCDSSRKSGSDITNDKKLFELQQLEDVVFQIPESKRPVVLFFDAQAKGAQFIQNYGEMFQSLNIGVVASNYYRNGITGEEAGKVLQQMMQVAQQQGCDMDQIYLMGFSGGAKFAQNLAVVLPNVKAVITMGMAKNHNHNDKVPEINIIGINDMNFQQLIHCPLHHDDFEKPNLIVLHENGHVWAPVEIVKYVMQYCESGFQSDEVQLPAQQDTYVNALNIALNMFNSEQKADAKEALKNLVNDVIQQEQQWLVRFQPLFESTHLQAWVDLMKELEREEKDIHVKERVMGYMSLVNYVLSEKYIKERNFEKAEAQLAIYKEVDLDNPDILLLTALKLAEQGKIDEAMDFIQKAISKGFNEYQKLYYMNFPDELTKREDFVLTLNQIYPN
jgi:dienelactone hydrolase